MTRDQLGDSIATGLEWQGLNGNPMRLEQAWAVREHYGLCVYQRHLRIVRPEQIHSEDNHA